MSSIPPLNFERIGEVLRRRRQQFGLSTDALADRANVARYTIIRVEKGKPCTKATLTKLMKALRLWGDQVLHPKDFGGPFRIHRQAETRWCVSVPKAAYQKNQVDEDRTHVDDEQERKRLGEVGFQPFFTAVMDTSMFGEGMEHAMMELHQASWVDQHYGEEFVYCIRGTVVLTIDGIPCTLEGGDAISFDANLPHQYAPASPVDPKDPAPRILIVVAARRNDQIGLKESRPPGWFPSI